MEFILCVHIFSLTVMLLFLQISGKRSVAMSQHTFCHWTGLLNCFRNYIHRKLTGSALSGDLGPTRLSPLRVTIAILGHTLLTHQPWQTLRERCFEILMALNLKLHLTNSVNLQLLINRFILNWMFPYH